MSRQDETWELVLKIGVPLVWLVAELLKRRRSAKGAPAPEPAAGPEVLEALQAGLAADLAALRGRAERVADGAGDLLERLQRARGPVPVLRRATSAQIQVPAQALATSLAALEGRLPALATLADARGLQADAVALEPLSGTHLLELRFSAMGLLVDQRTDRELARLVEDADAAADALLAPLRAFAARCPRPRGGARPLAERPLCVPSGAGDESVWLGLFPGMPLVVVPPDVGVSLPRWASLPHEVGHVLWSGWPGYADEVRARLGLRLEPVIRLDGSESGEVTLRRCLSAWWGEMHADAFAGLTLGPAALRGFVEAFADPRNPSRLRTIHEHGGRFAPHPPAELRVRWSVYLLERLAFEHEPRALLARWAAQHGPGDTLHFRLGRFGAADVPLEPVYQLGTQLLDAWLDTQWRALDGVPVGDIPDLPMGLGLWARVQRHAAALATGRPVLDDPRAVLAAAIEAWALEPRAAGAIARATRTSIVGLESDDRRASPNIASESAGDLPGIGIAPAMDPVMAVVLREVLGRRPGGYRPRGPGTPRSLFQNAVPRACSKITCPLRPNLPDTSRLSSSLPRSP